MRLLLTFILLLLLIYGKSQVKTIGVPEIKNYSKSEYNAATQNWDIAQDSKGFMYFANNDGVLRFDGSQWNSIDPGIPLPVRSVFIDSKDRIFVGLIDNFGILEVSSSGTYTFNSLRHLLDNNISFTDVWKIHEIEEGIVFQTFEHLFIYNTQKAEKIEVFSPQSKYQFSFNVDGKLIIQDFNLGLFEFNEGEFQKIPWSNKIIDKEILSIIKTDDGLILGTLNGLYKYESGNVNEWKCQVNEFINTGKLFTAISIFGNQLAFGTVLDGLIISDSQGNVLQHLDRDNGLQNNTILNLYSDKDKNLWLGLDNGIDYVEINSPLSYITEGGEIGTGYCCIVHNQKLYLGTNQGLFVKPFENLYQGKENFRLIKNTEGQVWSLTVKNNQLICGHKFGTFLIDEEQAIKINDEPGGWIYISPKNDPNTLIGGFYSGLVMFKFINNTWQFDRKLEGFKESSRFIVEDKNGHLWISHGARGVFKITFKDENKTSVSYKLYNENSGLPSMEKNVVISYKNNFYVSTINGIYEYVQTADSFMINDDLNKLIGLNIRIKHFTADAKKNLWFVGDDFSGVLRLNEDLTYTRITTPFEVLNNKFVNEFEFIYPYNNNHTFFAIDNGFAHYAASQNKSYMQPYNTYLTKIELTYLDSTLYPQNVKNDIPDKFPFKKNSFRFHFTSPFFENLSDLHYSYYLENYSEKWSEWSTASYKDYTNLFEGDYTFHVKAKNVYNAESEISTYSFTIIPPWHRSSTAYYIYAILSLILIFLGIRYILYRINLTKQKEKFKHENELKKQEEEFQRQALITEKEIIKLRNEKLRAEKTHRDKELANQTMNLVQVNKFLKKLDEELQRIQNNTKDAAVITKLAIIKNRIKKEIDEKQQNQLFETYFEDVHTEFFKRLKDKHPELSPGDLRLSAYIRMNISTKEIATLLNIGYRGVEIRRYRLRKKMNLSREINLSTYLLNI